MKPINRDALTGPLVGSREVTEEGVLALMANALSLIPSLKWPHVFPVRWSALTGVFLAVIRAASRSARSRGPITKASRALTWGPRAAGQTLPAMDRVCRAGMRLAGRSASRAGMESMSCWHKAAITFGTSAGAVTCASALQADFLDERQEKPLIEQTKHSVSDS